VRVLDHEGLTTHRPLKMTVTNAVVELRGLVESEEERLAMRIAPRTSLA
jgi:osmotically-inducible protein OsmY